MSSSSTSTSTSPFTPRQPHPADAHELTESDITTFQTSLLKWYDENQRTLPWRKSCGKDGIPLPACPHSNKSDSQRAYEVMCSELMLQQTQVSTVIPYYERWMERFPTIQDLAAADVETVNTLWQGLGYYSRAKRLLEAAKLIVEKYDGVIPSDPEKIRTIPGVGPYTAGAVLSIGYNVPIELVDGNVIRVVTRLRALAGDVTKKEVINFIWKLAKDMLHKTRPGHFNQALMDLGATICTPANPSCGKCPVSQVCLAYAESKRKTSLASKQKLLFGGGATKVKVEGGDGDNSVNGVNKEEEGAGANGSSCTLCLPPKDIEDLVSSSNNASSSVSLYPIKIKKTKQKLQTTRVAIVQVNGKYLLVQRPKTGLLAGLFEFPSFLLETGNGSTVKEEDEEGNDEDDYDPEADSKKKGAKGKKRARDDNDSTASSSTSSADTPSKLIQILSSKLGIKDKAALTSWVSTKTIKPLSGKKEILHIFSHIRMTYELFHITLPTPESIDISVLKDSTETLENGFAWLSLEDIRECFRAKSNSDKKVAISTAMKKVFEALLNHLGEGGLGNDVDGGDDKNNVEEENDGENELKQSKKPRQSKAKGKSVKPESSGKQASIKSFFTRS